MNEYMMGFEDAVEDFEKEAVSAQWATTKTIRGLFHRMTPETRRLAFSAQAFYPQDMKTMRAMLTKKPTPSLSGMGRAIKPLSSDLGKIPRKIDVGYLRSKDFPF